MLGESCNIPDNLGLEIFQKGLVIMYRVHFIPFIDDCFKEINVLTEV